MNSENAMLLFFKFRAWDLLQIMVNASLGLCQDFTTRHHVTLLSQLKLMAVPEGTFSASSSLGLEETFQHQIMHHH